MTQMEAKERNEHIRADSRYEHFDTTTSPHGESEPGWIILVIVVFALAGIVYLVSLTGGH